MRVLHIFFDDSAETARQGLAVLSLGHSHRGGCTPVVACPEGSALAQELAGAGLAVLSLPKGNFRYLFAWRRIVREFRARPFAIVHTHDAQAARLGAKCRAAWPEARWAHSWWGPSLPSRPKDFNRFRRADALTALNEETTKRLAAQNFAVKSVRAIPLGIDPAAYPPRLELEDARLRFAAVGPLTADSGYEWLLDSLARFKAVCPQTAWELRLVGEGDLFRSVLQRAETLGISEHMAFLGAQRSCDILPQCDILIAPDLGDENGCAAIKEAWAVGLPVLCSDLPVHGEMVRDGASGFIAPRGDAEALSLRLRELAADPKLRDELARGGRAALEDYTQERMINAYIELYEQITATESTEPDGPGTEA